MASKKDMTPEEYRIYRNGYANGQRAQKESKNYNGWAYDLRIAAYCLNGVKCSCNEMAVNQIEWCIELINGVADKIFPLKSAKEIRKALEEQLESEE